MRIDLEELRNSLAIKAEYFDKIDSTSLYLARLIKEKKPVPELVIADFQENGQGRIGKKFFSPAATGLYLTFAFCEKDVLCEDITPRVALAVLNAIFQSFGIQCGLKWVNDIYLNDKKIAGVLCQRVESFILIGIGINILKPDSVPDELENRLGFLTNSCSQRQCIDLIASLYKNIAEIMQIDIKEVLDSYRKLCVHIGKTVQIEKDNQILTGICLGIADDFSILIDVNGEVSSFSSGYMTLKI